jgi:hypothetical protein
MAKVGPRGKLEAAQPLIIRAIKKGLTFKLAAEMGGVHETTVHNWMAQGRKAKHGKYRDFYLAVGKARAEQAQLLLGRIEKHSLKDWKCCAWMLERVHGYHRDGIPDIRAQPPELPPQSTDLKEVLLQQTTELRSAMAQASGAQSWQAYAALQRQLLAVLQQIRDIDADTVDEVHLTDDQLLSEIQGAILSLPPVLRQRLTGAINGLDNVFSIVVEK